MVIGTSLEVFSAYRFIVRAVEHRIPIGVINQGETRMERMKLPISYRSSHDCAELLDRVS
jgi:hypothetical protein